MFLFIKIFFSFLNNRYRFSTYGIFFLLIILYKFLKFKINLFFVIVYFKRLKNYFIKNKFILLNRIKTLIYVNYINIINIKLYKLNTSINLGGDSL